MPKFLRGLSIILLLAAMVSCDSGPTDPGDETAPTLAMTNPVSPVPNATGVALATTVTAAFSEALDASTVTATSFRLTAAGTPVAAALGVAGATVTLTPSAALAGGTTFTVTINSDVTDLAGNAFAGYSWTFTTIETTPPTVVGRTPDAAATEVALGAAVSIVFSEPMDPATITATTITLTGPAGPVPSAVVLGGGGTTATLTPVSPLTEFASSYEVTVTTGVEDANGNALAVASVWSFQTKFVLADHWYRLTNDFLGAGRSLDTYSDSKTCFMGTTGLFTGQLWRLTDVGGGYYRLSNLMTGAGEALEGGDGSGACLLTGGGFTGQAWRFLPLGAAKWRLQNANLGEVRSLDNDGGTEIPYMALTGPYTGQYWTLTRVMPIEAVAPTANAPDAGAANIPIIDAVRIAFSEAMDATTVAAAFSLTGPGGAVPGTLTMNATGDTASFQATDPLVEFGTSYSATLTTAAKDRSGNALAAQLQFTFTTERVSDAMWYRLTNDFLGDGLSLDTYSDTKGCFMGTTGAYSGQYWRFEPYDATTYYLSNAFTGNAEVLEGGDGVNACLLTGKGLFTGQIYSIVPDGVERYRLQNLNFGAARSLDTYGGGSNIPYMAETGPYTGQYWKITRIGPR